MYGKKKGRGNAWNTPSDEPFYVLLGKQEIFFLIILEHKDKYQKVQAHQHKGVEPKRIEHLGFCVEDDSMYENGAGVYNYDSREAYGA